jgi:aryl-alcohol dehydrogenase-like predicted oxidoreductase
MKYAKMGKANVEVSRICLGTMHFGPKTEKKDAFRIMDRALDMGINFFDTANVYGGEKGPGTTESIVGEWFEKSGRRNDVVLATKVYHSTTGKQEPNEAMGISRYKIRRHLEDSLRRLRTDRIELYQVHHIDRRITPEEFWDSFEFHRSRGEIAYVGTSNFPGWGLVKYDLAAHARGMLGIVSEQAQYNLLSRYPELEVIPAAQDRGIGLMPYMPLGGGTLSGSKKPESGSRTEQVVNEYKLPSLDGHDPIRRFHALADEIGVKPHIVAIAWVLHNPAVYSAIVGVRTEAHLDGLEEASELELDDETMKRLGEIFTMNAGRPLATAPAPEAFAW